jgi:hypothetical protein
MGITVFALAILYYMAGCKPHTLPGTEDTQIKQVTFLQEPRV